MSGSSLAAEDLAELLAGLEPIGRSERGTTRLAWTPEQDRATDWFARTAAQIGLRTERDPGGNMWACPAAPGPWWAVSHLDSVREGGRYDGALGVVAGFAVAARSRVPLAVVAFADEEGARFNTPAFGSRALVSRLDASEVLARVDERGVTMREAMGAAGVDPHGLGEAPGSGSGGCAGCSSCTSTRAATWPSWPSRPAWCSGWPPRMRVEVELGGSADHAGTTRRTERRDALLAAARLIVRADELAPPAMVVTAGRILVEPNAPTTVPSRVRLWLDARAPSPEELDSWWTGLEAASAELRSASGVELRVVVASINRGTVFDARVRGALREAGDREGLGGAPEIVCFAGHDAGVIAERRPAGMVLVRNVAGVSHARAEDVDLEDTALAARIVQAAVEALA